MTHAMHQRNYRYLLRSETRIVNQMDKLLANPTLNNQVGVDRKVITELSEDRSGQSELPLSFSLVRHVRRQ